MEKTNYDRIPKGLKRAIIQEKEGYTDYLTSSKECYREYKNPILDKDTNAILGLDYEGFSLPKQLVYVDGEYTGLVKNHVKGKDLNNISEVISIRAFVDALKTLESQLIELTNSTGLYVSYIDPSDIVWHSDALYDLNPDRMTYNYNYRINPYFENMKELANMISKLYYDVEFRSTCLEQMRMDSIVNGTIRPSDIMTEVLDRLYRVADIDNIRDFKDGVMLLKK